VRLSSRRLMAMQERPLPRPFQVAASCHDLAELEQASRIGADFVVLSPVLATASHPQTAPLGWERFLDMRMQSDMPAYALGGMQPEHLSMARIVGAQGIAMIRGLWDAPSTEHAVQAVLR